jgi:hypothetical protein
MILFFMGLIYGGGNIANPGEEPMSAIGRRSGADTRFEAARQSHGRKKRRMICATESA